MIVDNAMPAVSHLAAPPATLAQIASGHTLTQRQAMHLEQSPYALRVTGEEVRRIQFGVAHPGYHPGDVDRLLETIAVALDAGQQPEAMVRGINLRMRWRGYRREEVDRLLRTLQEG